MRMCVGEYAVQRKLRDLKGKISAQSKKNFVLERDVRHLDARIALLIQSRRALDDIKVRSYYSPLLIAWTAPHVGPLDEGCSNTG
jgi:hypothetical protein